MATDRCPACGNVGRDRICHPDDDITSEANLSGSWRSTYPEHDTSSAMACWCQPYRDSIDPEVIIHRGVPRV